MLIVPLFVLAAFVGWGLFYLALRPFFIQSPESRVRLVTAVHAVLSIILSVLDWAYIRTWEIQNMGEPNTRYQEVVLSLTLGYFLFDMLWITWYQIDGSTMYIHHLASIYCITYILSSGVSAAEAILCLSMLESTNPCLQARWFLRIHGFSDSRLHTLLEGIFTITFLFLRMGYCSHVVFHMVISHRLHFWFKIGALSLHTVTTVFSYQLIAYVVKKYFFKIALVN